MSIQEHAAPSPVSSVLRVLIVTMSERYLAFDAECVTGVVTTEDRERGDDLAMEEVVDKTDELTVQLKMTKAPTYAPRPVVLLTNRGFRYSVRVDHVHGLLEIHPSQILLLPAQFSNVERHWYRGMILFEKSVAMMLNPMWLPEDHAGSHASSESASLRSVPDAGGVAIRDGRAC